MIYKGKFEIIVNLITACDYDYIVNKINKAIIRKKTLLISPMASHTLVRAYFDKELKKVLDHFDYLLPDSQYLRWSIPFLYGKDKSLPDRVYGPELMIRVCQLAEKKNYEIFLYGNKMIVLEKLVKVLKTVFKKLKIGGWEESRFRDLEKKEWEKLKNKILTSKTKIIFVSLGSPKQEIFAYHLSKVIKKPMVIIPVGAAFDFISGFKKQAPKWMQKSGLEWFFRLLNEPRRLWRRYFIYGPLYVFLIVKQKFQFLFFNR